MNLPVTLSKSFLYLLSNRMIRLIFWNEVNFQRDHDLYRPRPSYHHVDSIKSNSFDIAESEMKVLVQLTHQTLHRR